MIECLGCGNKYPDGTKYCLGCGRVVDLVPSKNNEWDPYSFKRVKQKKQVSEKEYNNLMKDWESKCISYLFR